jgi:hypothetical protein
MRYRQKFGSLLFLGSWFSTFAAWQKSYYTLRALGIPPSASSLVELLFCDARPPDHDAFAM